MPPADLPGAAAEVSGSAAKAVPLGVGRPEVHVVAAGQPQGAPTGERERHEVGDTVGVQILESIQDRQFLTTGKPKQHRSHAGVAVLESEGVGPVEVKRHVGHELARRSRVTAGGVLQVDEEVVVVPEREVLTTVAVEVQPMDPAQIPRRVLRGDSHLAVGQLVSVRPRVEKRFRNTDLHRVGKRTIARLKGDPEAVRVGQTEVVAPVAVQVPHHVEVRNPGGLGCVEVGGRVDENLLRPRVQVESMHTRGPIGDETVVAVDTGDVHEQHAGFERNVGFLYPFTAVECQQVHMPLSRSVHAHDRKRCLPVERSEKEGLVVRRCSDEFVVLERFADIVDSRSRRATRDQGGERGHRSQATHVHCASLTDPADNWRFSGRTKVCNERVACPDQCPSRYCQTIPIGLAVRGP